MSKRFQTIIKVIVSIGLLAILLEMAGPAQVIETISGSNPIYLIAAFLLILLGTVIAAYRWYIVMDILNFKGSLWFYFKSYFMGVFFNQLLPSSIGGDAYKVIDVSRLGYRKRDAFVGVLIDRGLGVLGIFIVNLLFNNLLPTLLPEAIYHTLNIVSLCGIAGFILVALLHKVKISLWDIKVFSALPKISADLFKVVNSYRKAILQIILTMAVHMVTFIGVYFIALGIGVDLSISTFMVIMPPVILLTIIPISLAGWGIREGAMIGLLGFAGVPKDLAVSISIIYGVSYILQGVIGLIFWIKFKKESHISYES